MTAVSAGDRKPRMMAYPSALSCSTICCMTLSARRVPGDILRYRQRLEHVAPAQDSDRLETRADHRNARYAVLEEELYGIRQRGLRRQGHRLTRHDLMHAPLERRRVARVLGGGPDIWAQGAQ